MRQAASEPREGDGPAGLSKAFFQRTGFAAILRPLRGRLESGRINSHPMVLSGLYGLPGPRHLGNSAVFPLDIAVGFVGQAASGFGAWGGRLPTAGTVVCLRRNVLLAVLG